MNTYRITFSDGEEVRIKASNIRDASITAIQNKAEETPQIVIIIRVSEEGA